MPQQERPAEPATLWETEIWDELLANLDERRVVPIIGPDLLEVETPRGRMLLHRFLAVELGDKLGIADAIPKNPSLNDVVCAHLRRGHRREALYPRVKLIMQEAAIRPPEALRKLAEIQHFDLFVTTNFDTLLEQALNDVRFGGQPGTVAIAYSTREMRDLSTSKRDLRSPVVYQLFGRLTASPSYVLSDEDLLEFIFALQSPAKSPERLFDELGRNHLLLLGENFADWLTRLFLRTTKGQRLSESRDGLEIVADSRTPSEVNLVSFLEHFSSRTRIYAGTAGQFVDELHRRYLELSPPTQARSSQPRVRDRMSHGAIFISYASEDRPAVELLKSGLEAAGLPVWFDRDQLQFGEEWRETLRSNIDRCGLFVPILSENTERRIEGEFRREWRWALDREQRMALGRQFIFPVVVDRTKSFAAVERRFLELHLAWLEGGVLTPEFGEQLRRSLEALGDRQGGGSR